jgi:hypothetical protein
MRAHLFLLLLCVISLTSAQNCTECNQQLHNYYVALGMPMVTPVLPAINFTSGVMGGVPYVTVTVAIQAVAAFYSSLLPNASTPFPWVVDFTVDNPWCASNILFQCVDNVTFGLAKTTNCTSIVDFDLGGSDPIAGRFFIYSNQSIPACNGTSMITFFNVTLNASLTDTYTYDAVGIRQGTQQSYSQAVLTYATSTCNCSDGNPASIATQNIFVCTEPRLYCNGTRSGGTPSLQVIPVPTFACIGFTVNGNSMPDVIWRVSSLQPEGGVSGSFGITFVTSLAFAQFSEQAFAASGVQYILLAQTRRQFNSGINSLTQFALLFRSGQWTNIAPKYPFSSDPLIAAIPCACGFTMDCYAGTQTADITSQVTAFVDLNNAIPVCNAGINPTIGLGTPNFTLNASLSFDPDNAPAPFNVYWTIYSTPYDPNPPPFGMAPPSPGMAFSLPNPQQMIIVIPSATLPTGSYVFILYASDLQSQVPCMFNVTISPVEVFAIVQADAVVAFTFYSGLDVNHSCLIFPPQPSIPVLGNYSYATDPSAILNYSWVQWAGPPLTPPVCDPTGFFSTSAMFDTNLPVMQFVPGLPAIYCFTLTVSAINASNSSANVCITVNPNFSQPPISLTPIFNFTSPPIRNLTPPTRPIISFAPLEQPPFVNPPPVNPPPPTPNGTFPPFIPIFPPPSRFDFLLLAGIFLVSLFCYLLIMAACVAYGEEKYQRVYSKRTLGGSHF